MKNKKMSKCDERQRKEIKIENGKCGRARQTEKREGERERAREVRKIVRRGCWVASDLMRIIWSEFVSPEK